MGHNSIEREVIFLKAINEIIDSVVNLEVLGLCGTDPDTTVYFKSSTHRKFFNIILVDFLSKIGQKRPAKPDSYLGALQEISENPNFSVKDSVASLRSATCKFVEWLEQKDKVPNVWLPSINVETTITISRSEFIRMCGNISKHNFLRLDVVARKLKKVIKENSGISIKLEDAILALGDFYEWFHGSMLSYHSSVISELLNNIRWGIYEYLQPEFHSSIVWEKRCPPIMYQYTYPKGITNNFAKECYWDLMNDVNKKPYFQQFKATKSLRFWFDI